MKQQTLSFGHNGIEDAIRRFPSTRYQGSKRKLLPFLHAALSQHDFKTAIDLYCGTASVSLLLRMMGKRVIANDYLRYNSQTAELMLSLQSSDLDTFNIEGLIGAVFSANSAAGTLVRDNYSGIYFTDQENQQIDIFCANICLVSDLQRAVLVYLMGQAMLMKRPYNLFHRANLNMRTSSVIRSFGNATTWEAPFSKHMISIFNKLRQFPFQGPVGEAKCQNTTDLSFIKSEPDLIYLDPPYLNKNDVAVDYFGFYHFLDGLVDYNLFGSGDTKLAHKPIGKETSRWSTAAGGLEEIAAVAKRWPHSIIAISYRGNGRPAIGEIKSVLTDANYGVCEHVAKEYKYALSKSFDTTEELIIGMPG